MRNKVRWVVMRNKFSCDMVIYSLKCNDFLMKCRHLIPSSYTIQYFVLLFIILLIVILFMLTINIVCFVELLIVYLTEYCITYLFYVHLPKYSFSSSIQVCKI